MTGKARRAVSAIVGAIVILAVGAYVPVMLIGPLPEATVTVRSNVPMGQFGGLTLPKVGASAAVEVPDDATTQPGTTATGSSPQLGAIATAGQTDAIPLGGIAKLVTVLVSLHAKPVPLGQPGPNIAVQAGDVTELQQLTAMGARVVNVTAGDQWSVQDTVRAVLVSGSAIHASMLAKWAFGSLDSYLAAAQGWLRTAGLTSVRVADATGLDERNIGTATDAAGITALAAANPQLRQLIAPGFSAPNARALPDVLTSQQPAGVLGYSRSFTDQAGVNFAFTLTPPGSGIRSLAVVMLRMPDYPTLNSSVAQFTTGALLYAQPVAVIRDGTPYADVRTVWEQRSTLVATHARTLAGWTNPSAVRITSSYQPFATALQGTVLGRVDASAGGASVGSQLTLADTISDPGPLWRLTHPLDIVGAFFRSVQPR